MKFSLKIPLLTYAQLKLIRTLEGKLIVAFNLLVVVATLATNLLTGNPHLLPPKEMAVVLAVVNGVTMLARQALKATLTLQKLTPPEQTPTASGTSPTTGPTGILTPPERAPTASGTSATVGPTTTGNPDLKSPATPPTPNTSEGPQS